MKRRSVMLVLAAGLFMTAAAQAQQRSTGAETQDQERGRVLERLNDQVRAVIGTRDGVQNLPVLSYSYSLAGGGAWWTNKALVDRIGLTDDQKSRIERAFENHRSNIESNQKALEKEEAQLGRLLDAEKVDRGAVLSQIDRVTQARSELERTNSVMTLEMREVLTRTQWSQLPQTTGKFYWQTGTPGIQIEKTLSTGQRGGGARGQRQ